MKNLFLCIALLFQFASNAQTIEPAPADKSVVYFVRASSLGAIINFTYFDNDKVIGKFNGPKYMRYECEPGEHLFWAKSENKDFINANLVAGKIYVVEVIPQMGAFITGVGLSPVNDADYRMKSIKKLLAKRTPTTFRESELEAWTFQMRDVITRGLGKAKKIEGRMETLEGLVFSPEDLIYVKKKRK
jgi:hypothetical protein